MTAKKRSEVDPYFGKVMYDEYTIHTATKNISFIKLFRHLKDQGVKNNKFFLKLYDSSLMMVDPHSKHLTKEQKGKIIVEITRNPWYFLREVVRIPAPGKALRFELHRGNLAVVWAILNNFNPILLLPRQKGKTMSVAAILAWIYDYGTTNSQMLFSNKSVADANNNLKRLKDIRGLLPAFVQDAIFNDQDTNNIESIINYKRNNSIKCNGSPNSHEAADKQGRGMTTPILWLDEFAFLRHNGVVYKSAAPAQSKVAEIAKDNGKPFSKIITTTPNNLDSAEGEFCHSMIVGACEFTEELYDMTRDEAEQYITANSNNDFLYIKFTWQQLGLDDAWYSKECRALANDQLVIRREIDLAWTKASDNSVFSEEQLDVIFANLVDEPLETVMLDVGYGEHDRVHEKYPLKIYRELFPEKRYLIGVDTSGGTGNDCSAFTIVDPADMYPCAVFRNNKINISYYTDLLEWMIKEILPNSILVIERNSYGKSLVDNLVRKIPSNLFYDYQVKDKDKDKLYYKKDNIIYGVNTTVQSRDAMIDLLVQIVDQNPEILGVKEIYEEVKTLVYNSKGKVEHEKGCHDDVVFSYLFVRYAVAYSNSISTFLRTKSSVESNVKVISSGSSSLRTIADVNATVSADPSVAMLSIQELIDLRERGVDILKYAKEKNSPNIGARELVINKSIVGTIWGSK